MSNYSSKDAPLDTLFSGASQSSVTSYVAGKPVNISIDRVTDDVYSVCITLDNGSVIDLDFIEAENAKDLQDTIEAINSVKEPPDTQVRAAYCSEVTDRRKVNLGPVTLTAEGTDGKPRYLWFYRPQSHFVGMPRMGLH